MSFTQGANRRDFLSFLGGGALLALGLRPAKAAETRIAGLIAEAQSKGSISAKIDFIAAALRGTRYYAHSLIGGPLGRSNSSYVTMDLIALLFVKPCSPPQLPKAAANSSPF